MKKEVKKRLSKFLAKSLAIAMTLCLVPGNIKGTSAATTNEKATKSALPKHVLVGYWHNFDNGTGFIPLKDVNDNWDVINLSFGEPTSQTSGDIKFEPYQTSEADFKEQVKYLQSKGKRVLLSIGGQNGHVSLVSEDTKNKFVKSTCEIIDKYGLDGLDIDFEGTSLSLDSGNDPDFKNPTTPVIVNTIAALKEIKAKYGEDFLLTFAPETFFVQHGHRFYGGINSLVDSRVGAYLPVLYALRDELSWVQVQLYNSCEIWDNNNKSQSPGNSEFIAALTDMLINGFTLNNGNGPFFPGLREDQIVVGVPSNSGAAGAGVLTNEQYKEALDALYLGGKAGSYEIKKGHPNLRGLMAWSCNWDAFYKFSFSNFFRNYFDTLPQPNNTFQEATLETTSTSEANFQLTGRIPSYNTATSYKLYENGQLIDFGDLTVGNEQDFVFKKNIYSRDPNKYDYKIVVADKNGNELTSNIVTVNIKDTSGSKEPISSSPLPQKLLVGYWHNFDNGSGFIRLRNVPDEWNVINLSFGEPTSVTSGDIRFTPYGCTEEEFLSDVQYLHNKGKKVILSIGGQNGQVQLKTAAAKNTFVSSVSAIVDKYGLDGLDIDFEGNSLYFEAGDTDYKHPTTPVITNLIDALNELTDKYGDNFYLTMAPETFFVQNAYTGYGYNANGGDQRRGSYLPVIYALRDKLDWLQVQYYNSGPIMAPDNNYKNMGSAEFMVALADMLLSGFSVPGNDPFPALRDDQVVLGVPACMYAGNGFTSLDTIKSAMDTLIKGGTSGGWTVSTPHPNLRGVMAWSINWDIRTDNKFAPYFRSYLDDVSKSIVSLKAPTISASDVVDDEVTLKITFPGNNIATKYSILEDSEAILTENVSASSSDVTIEKKISLKGKKPKYYEFAVTAFDANNNALTSNKVYVKLTNEGEKADVNGDGKVDALDISLISQYYNVSIGDAKYNEKYDVNRDGIIDVYDLVKAYKYVA